MNIFTWSVTIKRSIPDHPARPGDPHYKHFIQARKRMLKLGLLKCWICGDTDNIELHHSLIEYALQNGVDMTKFTELYPEFGEMDDETFKNWIEGEGNLTPLCRLHHTGDLGIHTLTYPEWLPLRFWKKDIPPPGIRIKKLFKK